MCQVIFPDSLLETAPWRIVYAVTLPLSGAGCLLAWWWLDVVGLALLAVAVSTLLVALMQERLVAEASTAAWQDYFLFNTGLALIGLIPALPCWRRQKYDPAAAPPPTPRAATSQGVPVSQAALRVHPGRTP